MSESWSFFDQAPLHPIRSVVSYSTAMAQSYSNGNSRSIYIQYYGALVFIDKITAALEAGKPAEFGDTHFVTQPRFETGDARYKWLNSVMAVAEGRVMGGRC